MEFEDSLDGGDDLDSEDNSQPGVSGETSFAPNVKRGPGRPRRDPMLQGSSPRVRGRGRVGLPFPFRGRGGSSTSPSCSSPSTPGAWDASESPQYRENPSQDLRGARCAFCYLGDCSMLGQGDLRKHPSTQTSVPINLSLTKREDLRCDNISQHQRPRTRGELELCLERGDVLDDMDMIGLPDDVTIQDIITPTGDCMAHFCCAAWSEGVSQAENGQQLLNVDLAVLAAINILCNGCSMGGASIGCRHENCPNKYHYPCASAYGGFIGIQSLVFFCPEHVNDAAIAAKTESTCGACTQIGDVSQQLFCNGCGVHYHAQCTQPRPLNPDIRLRAGWQCAKCKMCHNKKCRIVDDKRMLFCEACDKNWHPYCLEPPVGSVPKSGWRCKTCRFCHDCGSRTPGAGHSSRWHANYTICDSCYQQRNKGFSCVVCQRAYRFNRLKSMKRCSTCKKYVHYECDANSSKELGYSCPSCLRMEEGGLSVQKWLGGSNPPSVSTIDERETEAERDDIIVMTSSFRDSIGGADSPASELAEVGDNTSLLGKLAQVMQSPGLRSPLPPIIQRKILGPGMGKGARKKPPPIRRSKSGVGSGKGRAGLSAMGMDCGPRRRGRPARTASQSLVSLASSNDDSQDMPEGGAAIAKDDEDYIHTIVVTHSADQFVFAQDMCVICGSFGLENEGILISCVQCGQCYHNFCANVKMSQVILTRGWRCLDCTVCEGCGRGDDEPHLLLCDDCDVSFHTYCLTPPLNSIPQGAWKCKWCAQCVCCGKGLPDTVRQDNQQTEERLCAQCASTHSCPKCKLQYKQNDLIIQCHQCQRWIHGKCEDLFSEEMLESASEKVFRCSLCKPLGAGPQQTTNLLTADNLHYTMDCVSLTKSGLEQTQWRIRSAHPMPRLPIPTGPGRRPAALMAAHNIDSTIDQVMGSILQDRDDDNNDDIELEDWMLGHRKQRGRRVIKLGVGGFLFKPPRQRTQAQTPTGDPAPGCALDTNVDRNSTNTPTEDGPIAATDSSNALAPRPIRRRRRRNRTSSLEDVYPNVIQAAFFAPATQMPGTARPVGGLEERAHIIVKTNTNDAELTSAVTEQLKREKLVATCLSQSEDKEILEDLDLNLHNWDEDEQQLLDTESLFNMLEGMGDGGTHNDSRTKDNSPQSQAEIDIATDVNLGMEFDGDLDNVKPEPLGDIVPPAPQIVMQQQIKLEPNVVVANQMTHAPVQQTQVDYIGATEEGGYAPLPMMGTEPPKINARQMSYPQGVGYPNLPQNTSPIMRSNSAMDTPFVYPPQSMIVPPPSAMGLPQRISSVPTTPTTPITPVLASDNQSSNERGGDLKAQIERWEHDEPLGEKSTIAAILFVNLNHKELKERYPSWPDRVKQISKIWRGLSAEERSKYVQKARDNRAECRAQNKKKQVKESPPTPSCEGYQNVHIQSQPLSQSPMMEQQQHYDARACMISSPPMGQPGVMPVRMHNSPQQHEMSFKVPHPVTSPYPLPQQMTPQPRFQYNQPIRMPVMAPTSPIAHRAPPPHMHMQMDQQQIARPSGPPMNIQAQQYAQQQAWPGQGQGQYPNPMQMMPQPVYQPQPRDGKEGMLMARKQEMEERLSYMELELNKLRKQKKNLAARQRQVKKSGQEVGVEDLNVLEQLQAKIQATHKEVEKCKKEAKQSGNSLQEYQNQLGPARPPGPPMQPRMEGGPQPTPMPIMSPQQHLPPRHMMSEPPHTQMQSVHRMRMPTIMGPRCALPGPFAQMGAAEGHAYQETYDEGGMGQQRVMARETPFPANEMQMSDDAPKKTRKRRRARNNTEEAGFSQIRAPSAGGSGSNPFGMDFGVLATVQYLVDRVVMNIEGHSDRMIKQRIDTPELEGNNDNVFETVKRAMAPVPQTTPPRRYRKSMKRRPAVDEQNYQDPSAAAERLTELLKSTNRLPVQEPFPAPDLSTCQVHGITTLPNRADKTFTSGTKVGNLNLNFLPDFYTEVFGKKKLASVKPTDGHDNKINVKMEVKDEKIIKSDPVDDLIVVESMLTVDFNNPFPHLRAKSGRVSPDFKLMAPQVTVKAVPNDPPREMMYQRIPQVVNVKPDMSVPITLTLDGGDALSNVADVMRRLQLLLNMSSPIDYQVHVDTPPQTPEMAQAREICDSERRMQQQMLTCRQCQNIIELAMIKKHMAELGLTPKEEDGDEFVFCSHKCYFQFAVSYKTPITSTEAKEAERTADNDTLNQLSRIHPDLFNRRSLDAASTDQSLAILASPNNKEQQEEIRIDEIIASVVGSVANVKPQVSVVAPYLPAPKETTVHVRDIPPVSLNENNQDNAVPDKRWKGLRWQPWTPQLIARLINIQDQLNRMILSLVSVFRPPNLPTDTRKCELCSCLGDLKSEGPGRLLNMDAGRWIHVNCALWSSEVYETLNGQLVNVELAVRRGLTVACSKCSQVGATIPCYRLRCPNNYHFPCAIHSGCIFSKDKTMLCALHSQTITPEFEVLKSVSVLRRVYVERDESRLIAKLFQQGESCGMWLRVGNLIFRHVGQLLPQQLKAFHNKDFIYPFGYSVTRIYWSPTHLNRRVRYNLSIGEHDNMPQFHINFEDENNQNIIQLKQQTSNAVWSSVLSSIQKLRQQKEGLLKLFPTFLSGEALFGLNEPCVLKMIESLPGVDLLTTYTFKYGRNPLMDLPLAINPSGCARCEPRFRSGLKRPHAPLHAAKSEETKYSYKDLLLLSGISAEMMANPWNCRQGEPGSVSARFSQYKKMKQDWKNIVCLARSCIAGLGLYAKRDIEMNSLICEYLGEVIRSEVAERREKQYNDQNRGVYMFRIGPDYVVDATVTGGLARYINHSCDPNCCTQLINMGDNEYDTKIVVLACRPISKGEELTYDYQFDFEDDQEKLPCLCGAPNCRKWMN